MYINVYTFHLNNVTCMIIVLVMEHTIYMYIYDVWSHLFYASI